MPDIVAQIHDYTKRSLDKRFADQFFLREYVWPLMCQSVLQHDRLFHFMGSHPIRGNYPFDYTSNHIGCCEGGSLFAAKTGFPDHTPVLWHLYTRIRPLLNEDGQTELDQAERMVCTYSGVVVAGEVKDFIPRRYARGFADQTSRIEIIRQDSASL